MNHVVVIVAFFLSVAIIIATKKGAEQRAGCWAMIAFSVVNAWQIHFDPAPLQESSGFWFANQMLYAVGLAFWLQPLTEKRLESETAKISAIVGGVAFLTVAGFLYYLDRGNGGLQTVQCVSMNVEASSCTIRTVVKAWYDTSLLYDDVCVGMASGLLYAALSASAKLKTARAAKCP